VKLRLFCFDSSFFDGLPPAAGFPVSLFVFNEHPLSKFAEAIIASTRTFYFGIILNVKNKTSLYKFRACFSLFDDYFLIRLARGGKEAFLVIFGRVSVG
jgi:hypothetical protein